MSLLNTLISMMSLGSYGSTMADVSGTEHKFTSSGPVVNIDGTPMASDWTDVCGKPYGVMDFEDAALHTNESTSWDCGSTDLWAGEL
jgi:hypothetical protein